jgi:5-methylcytosine-specific restriction endonuclease McrA
MPKIPGVPRRPNYRPKINKGNLINNKKQTHPDKALYGEDWETLSAYVRKRDNYTCQIAKISSGKRCSNYFPPPFSRLLHAHHIIPLPRGTNNPTNLITLCIDCHGDLHGKYLGKISKKQKAVFRR